MRGVSAPLGVGKEATDVAAAAIFGHDIENGYLNAPVLGRFYLPLAGKRPNKRDTDTPMIVSSTSTQDAHKVCQAMAIQQYRLTLLCQQLPLPASICVPFSRIIGRCAGVTERLSARLQTVRIGFDS